jgi:hypothetical protein
MVLAADAGTVLLLVIGKARVRRGLAQPLALENGIWKRYRRQEHLRIRVGWCVVDLRGMAHLDDPPPEHNRDPVGDLAHDGKIVRDEEV